MARWFVTLLIIALAVAQVTARTVPSDAGLDDQKNVVTFGGLGGYSGIGSNGLPIGGIGGGVGTGADIVGVSGVAVGVGVGGNVGGSAGVGLGPLRGISRIRGKIDTGVGVGVGGGRVGSGSGIGTGSVPFP